MRLFPRPICNQGSSCPFSVHFLLSLWSAYIELGFTDLLVLGKYHGWDKPIVTNHLSLHGIEGYLGLLSERLGKLWTNRHRLVTLARPCFCHMWALLGVALPTGFLRSALVSSFSENDFALQTISYDSGSRFIWAAFPGPEAGVC